LSTASSQLGAAHRSVRVTQIKLSQSAEILQRKPSAQALGQMPPQSTSVSEPFSRPSSQVGR
jgi:hypothetical protein